MMIFDAPTREYCVVRRPRTNTPLQALALLNDPQIVEASRAFAVRILTEWDGDTRQRVTRAFRQATARTPTVDEVKILSGIYEAQLAHYQAQPDAADKLMKVGAYQAETSAGAPEIAAWTTVASMILNLDETLTKN